MTNVIRFRRRRGRWVARKLVVGVAVVTLAVAVGSQMTPPPLLQTEPQTSQKPRVMNGGGAWNSTGEGAWGGASSSPSPSGSMLVDRVTRVRDGDTIVVGLIPIRITNLDCAESGTAAGERAARRAKELAANQPVQCRLEGRRSYDREVGLCSLADGQDFGQVMISEGYPDEPCRRSRNPCPPSGG